MAALDIIILASIMVLASCDLWIVVSIGYVGPRCERRRGPGVLKLLPHPIALPDGLWVIPLVLNSSS